MERLTERWGDGNVRVKEHAYISAAQRLADYEDTGLTPEQCKNAKAIIERRKWIPVTERLPEPEVGVLVVCNRNGYIFVVQAIYEDGKMLTEDSAWNWNNICEYGLYDEETDDYYIPECWWEDRRFTPDDVYNNPIDCAVTHWMPLPDTPEVE